VLAALSARQATPAAVELVDDKLRTLLRDAAVGPSGFTLGGAPPSSSVVVTDGILSLAVLARIAFHTSDVAVMPTTPFFYSLGTNVPADRSTAEAVVAVVESGVTVTATQAGNPMARCVLSSEGVARRFALDSLQRVVAAVPTSSGATVPLCASCLTRRRQPT
jgi:antitoxin (DNA-binding transcriptional repressor) of toxin-antitoxin stability system